MQQKTSGRDAGSRWLPAARLWITLPLLVIIVLAGHALHSPLVGAVVAASYLVLRLGIGHWASRKRARIRTRLRTDRAYRERYNERSTRLVRFFAWYFVVLFALLGVVVVALVIARVV